jgi:uncharacterized SAM-binding protein YcdF (DUF218 family)
LIEPALIVKRIVDNLLLPPGGPLVLTLVGLLLGSRRPRLGKSLAWSGVVLGLVLSTRLGAYGVAELVEHASLPALSQAALKSALASTDPPGAIVLLAGGTHFDLRELPAPDLMSDRTLQRALHAVRVSRWSELPILVSGASVYVGRVAEAQTIARIIREDFRHPIKWVEDDSLDTAENASKSARMLKAAGVNKIVLVTDATHMWRSVLSYESAGLRVLPAPMAFSGSQGADWSTAWLPSAQGIGISGRALHELLGVLWYRLSRAIR